MVPQGATIKSAYLSLPFQAGNTQVFRVAGLDADDVDEPPLDAQHTYADHDSETTAYVDWTLPDQSGASGVQYNTTPDIKSIIEEIVGRSGWVKGNNLMLFVYHSTANQSADKRRTVYAVEDNTPTADEETKLEITY
tara:strand:+ start:1082 stop:1492 length:411 start_codon:yes stop_codon:yes gene_type:complete